MSRKAFLNSEIALSVFLCGKCQIVFLHCLYLHFLQIVAKRFSVVAYIEAFKVSDEFIQFQGENSIVSILSMENGFSLAWIHFIPKIFIMLTKPTRILCISPRISQLHYSRYLLFFCLSHFICC